MRLGDEFDTYLEARRTERTLRAQLATGELYQWVGDSEPIEEEASAAATWLGDHIGHRVEVRVNDVARVGILWLIETAHSRESRIGWRIRVGAEVWPLSVRSRCVRWTATYRAGDPLESWTRAVLGVAEAESATPRWASRYQLEDCAHDPPWLPAGARLHDG